MKMKMPAISSVLALMLVLHFLQTGESKSPIPSEAWGYVEVRNDAFMFWWLYGVQTSDPMERVHKPLVLWFQGGPGASSTGYGNFEEIGPLDVNLKQRNSTWTKEANVLFVDNPVGCGFSYVDEPGALTTNISGTLSSLLGKFLGVSSNNVFFDFSVSFCQHKGKCNIQGISLMSAISVPLPSPLPPPHMHA